MWLCALQWHVIYPHVSPSCEQMPLNSLQLEELPPGLIPTGNIEYRCCVWIRKIASNNKINIFCTHLWSACSIISKSNWNILNIFYLNLKYAIKQLTFGQSRCRICPSQEFNLSKYEALLTFSNDFTVSALEAVFSTLNVKLPSNWKTTTGAAVSNNNCKSKW